MKKLLTRDQMEALTTKRLIAYKNSLMQVPEGPDYKDAGDFNNVNSQLNKTSTEWKETYRTLKEVLATRENVEKK